MVGARGRELLFSMLVFAVGCGFDARVPPETLIHCTGPDACPAGFVCRTAIERCLPLEGLDETAPHLVGTPGILPAVGMEGTTFEISLEVSEPLFQLPEATLEGAEAALPIDSVEALSETQYLLTYRATGQEPEGLVPLFVDLVDRSGNAARRQRAGALRLDFTPPGLLESSVSLQLAASATSPVSTVTALGTGGLARLAFTVSESLAEPPTVHTTGPEQIALTAVASAGNTYLYELSPASSHATGRYGLEAALVDLAGNPARVPLADTVLELDTQDPAPPDVGTHGQVLYTRIPWGAQESEGAPVLRLTGAPGAVEGAGTLIVYTAASAPRAELGRTGTQADGRFELVMAHQDRPVVFVAFADGAGNLSESVAVRDVEWVATLGGKRPGESDPNPHRLELPAHQSASVVPRPAPEAGDADGVAREDGEALWTSGQYRWRRLSRQRPPAGMRTAVHDLARGRLMMFSEGMDGTLTDTWEWDGEDWFHPSDSAGPFTNRYLPAAAFDPHRARVVLVGGYGNWEFGGGTLEWTGAIWDFLEVADPEADGDPDRAGGLAMAFDEGRGRMVLHGADLLFGAGGDTWEWDGVSWARIDPIDPEGDGEPPPAYRPSLAYDPLRERVVLTGGRVGYNGTVLTDEIWEWDGVSWARLEPLDPEGDGNPPPHYGSVLTFDPRRGTLLLHGGQTVDGATNMLWEWNGASWARLSPADPEGDGDPPPETHPSLQWMESIGQMVTPVSPAGPFVELWSWTAESFARLETPMPSLPAPTATNPQTLGMARHEGSGTVIAVADGEVLELKGAQWVPVVPTDPERDGNPELYRGFDLSTFGSEPMLTGETARVLYVESWSWTGTSWRKRVPTDPENDGHPAGRREHATAYDAGRSRLVLFGGDNDLGDTWEWDGQSWRRMIPEDPEGDGDPGPLEQAAMAYDPARGEVVLFGGQDPGFELSDAAWGWNGLAWRRLEPVDPEGDGNPSARSDAALTWVPELGGLLLFGGETAFLGQSDELWLWNGASWRQLHTADTEDDGDPLPRSGHAMAYDPQAKGVHILGGRTRAGAGLDSWTLDFDPEGRPAQIFRVHLPSTRRPEGTVLEALSLRAVAAATGSGPEGAWDGARLLVWSRGRWVEVDASTSPELTPLRLPAPATDLLGALYATDPYLHFALVPHADHAHQARLGVDYLELRLRYSGP